MLEELFPKYHRRYSASPFYTDLERFAGWLVARGYGQDPAHDHVRRLRQALELAATPLTSPVSRALLDEMFAACPDSPLFHATRRAYERHLVDEHRLHIERDQRPHAELLQAYAEHLRSVRGLTASTVAQHLTAVQDLLQHCLAASAVLSALSEQQVQRHIDQTGRRISRQSLQHTVAQVRSFLRFCCMHGLLPQGLMAIDTPRVYRDELPPRALPWVTVQQLLRSIDRRSGRGERDHAILHLMAHYGLRPCEVVSLRLESIDWQAATMRVEQRKTRSVLVLPLTGLTLRLLKRYLRQGRPVSVQPELFLRARGPSGALKHTAVCDLYQLRAAASGLPLQNTSAYCLRHSFAMRLLERGVGVKTIGDVLGHRTLESTCVYLRLHTDALREVALPVPRETSAQ